MKKLPLLLLTCLLFFSCSENNSIDDLTSQKVEDLVFYNYDGEPLEQKDLVSSWNNMINDSETPYRFQAGTFSIKKIKTVDNDSFEYALVATNSEDQIQTAAFISEFKDGYKISNRSVSCYGCDVNLELTSKEGYWSCNGTNKNCIKTSRLDVNNNIESNLDTRILFGIQLDQETAEDADSIIRTVYSICTSTSNKNELCDTKILLNDIGYEETWLIYDKNDPKQNRKRTEMKEIDAQEVLEIMCNADDDAVFFSADLNKFGQYHQEYKAFLN
ncbi:hypothetical protein [Nonlabens ulvanivorans]|uniref:hypothetical protein n=1 Tax=Nonlabens ulvanivorans TaxID=906888 RepID=UPI0037C9CCFE